MLGQTRSKASRPRVKALRKTRSADVLVELGSGTKNKPRFGYALRSTLGGSATVRYMEPKATVELRNLDELSTVEEVSAVINTTLEGNVKANIFVSKTNSQGKKMTTFTLTAEKAGIFLAIGYFKIGQLQNPP